MLSLPRQLVAGSFVVLIASCSPAHPTPSAQAPASIVVADEPESDPPAVTRAVGPARAPGDDGDRDGDGVVDARDRCPDEPEDRDGFEDEDGCPDPDNDQDGVGDVADMCPGDAEDRDGFEDKDGCPDPDNDGDRIRDVDDKCPNEPETYDGHADEDGCPG